MSIQILATIITGSALLYAFMAGVAWQVTGAHWDDPGPFLASAAWPLVLPIVFGAKVARRLATRRVRLPRAQVRQ